MLAALDGLVKRSAAAGLCGAAVTLAASGAAAQPASAEQTYVAYRADSTTTPAAREQLVKKAEDAGLRPVKNTSLDRERLLVFEAADRSLVEKSAPLFKSMERIPINEFRGVFSVPTGSFYLRFDDDVTPAVARKRVEGAGFKVLTPHGDPGSFLVVERSGKPADRERELALLKKIEHLMYVAPNDIPIRVSRD